MAKGGGKSSGKSSGKSGGKTMGSSGHMMPKSQMTSMANKGAGMMHQGPK